MKTNSISLLVAAVVTSALSQACVVEKASEEVINEASSELRVLNGSKLSGVSLNGVNVGGATLDGVEYANVTIGGVPVSNVSVNGTVLNGSLPGGVAISGEDFIGAELSGQMSDGSKLTIRLDNIEVSAQSDILHYTVSYRDAGGSFVGLCGNDAYGAPIKAIALTGRWDNSQGTATGGSFISDSEHFTLACRGAAIAKCTEIAYRPFATAQQCTSWGECSTVSLQPMHQACVRMVRADYCGDGTSLTVTGTEIDMFDGLGLHDEDPTAQWDLEAEWTQAGAQCVLHPRWTTANGVDAVAYMQNHCPEKLSAPSCGGEDSTFFVDNGFATPAEERVFLRNKSEQH